MYSAFFSEFAKNGNVGDTTLRLDGFGYGTRETATFGNSQTNSGGRITCTNAPDDACKLVLGLGPTQSAYSDEYSPSGSNKDKPMTTILNQELSSQRDSILKLGLSGGTDAVSNVLEFSSSTHGPFDANRNEIPVADEGSTSAKKSGGYMTRLILAPRMENPEFLWTTEHGAKSHCQISQMSSEPSAVSNYSMSAISEPGSAAVSSDHRGSNIKKCKFAGCTKGARGATGLCIGHGGGQRCQKPGCNKGAESRTAYCKAHGGGRRCQHLGCTKSAEGKTDHCIAHGGGKRCGHPGGCTKAARGRSGLCIKHGGGKRCKVEDVLVAPRGKSGRRVVPCSAKRTVAENGACSPDARKAPKGVRLSAKGTVAGNVACLMVVGYARKASTEVRVSVWPTVEENGVLSQVVPKAHVGEPIVASNTVGGNGASLRTAVRVLRAAPISARPTVAENGAAGAGGEMREIRKG
ncbi:hypothetical protein DH2020_044933 [Rehmannia glutinosa]|uniref:WRKY19-like zinc finger domain-containing protein n=1 Tax=Rehmannia glutinosa TaxID=99300 RepID=A0ABR0UH92_REHGL